MNKKFRRIGLLITFLAFIFTTASADLTVERISGNNRYQTSLNVSNSYFDSSNTAVIASGEGFADALVGGVLAGYEEAPLYLSSKDNLENEIISEMTKLGVEQVYLLGGENSISQAVYNQLVNNGFIVKRISGQTRYNTAELVAKEIENNFNTSGKIYYADGRNYPDALSSAPMVVENEGILLLNDGSEIKGEDSIAIGGQKSVPGDVERIAGSNRYETALKISNQNPSSTAILVDGTNYPDALSASALACKLEANIILTEPTILTNNVKEALQQYESVIIIGGENSVSSNIQKILANDPGARELYKVVRVIDGDTIILNIDGVEERVRLIGVDTPESVHPDQNRNNEFGKIASDFTQKQIEGQVVGLELDVQERDKYGRVLGYIYVGDKMFNKTLIEEGMAQVATYPPNVKYVDEFLEAQNYARENKKGFWADEFDSSNQNTNNNQQVEDPKPTPTPTPDVVHGALYDSPYPDRKIKGNISSSGEKIYHVPGGVYYDRTSIDENAGERWFRTEAEARNAGWRKSKR